MVSRLWGEDWPHSRTEPNVPRRMACTGDDPKKTSTMFSQEPEVEVKCRWMRRLVASQARIARVLVGVVVVEYKVQLAARVGFGRCKGRT